MSAFCRRNGATVAVTARARITALVRAVFEVGCVVEIAGQRVINALQRDRAVEIGMPAVPALIEHLDLVITVDTAIVHLAGALGKPVWVLVPFSPSWRWMLNRSDSPWYPSARLFRQQTPGAWDTVIAEVTAALAERLRAPAETPTQPRRRQGTK